MKANKSILSLYWAWLDKKVSLGTQYSIEEYKFEEHPKHGGYGIKANKRGYWLDLSRYTNIWNTDRRERDEDDGWGSTHMIKIYCLKSEEELLSHDRVSAKCLGEVQPRAQKIINYLIEVLT